GNRASEEERRLDVDREDAVEGLLVGGGGLVAGEDPGVVDEDVDAAAERLGRPRRQVARGRRAAVEGGDEEGGPTARRLDLGDQRRAALGVPPARRDLGPLGRERPRDRAAEA